MIPICCVGCKHAKNNQCQQNYCWIYRVFRFFNKKYWVSKVRKCDDCAKHGTMACPNSFYCYSTEDKPHFEERSH